VVSWGYDPDARSAKPLQDYFEWVGTADPAAYLSVPAAIEFQAQHDWPQVRRDAHTLLAEARERISALTGLPQVTPDSTDWWVQLCAIPIPAQAGTTTTELNTLLREEFLVEAPFTGFDGRRFVRVSIQAYNSPRDVDRLVAGLRALLARYQ
jgi:isopenicillin-N epimerase